MKIRIKKSVQDPLSKVIPFPNMLSPSGLIESDIVGTRDDKITTAVKQVDEEDANIEAEKGEYILRPDLSGIYSIGGKTHKKGGTPLFVEPGSFIFSNSKDLAINQKEKEHFDFKKGTKKDKENTPAKVLAREIDTKEYNRLMSIVSDENSSEISKASAALMIQKFQKKIGQVAFLQEGKKQFPDGIPGFAQGTAPVKTEEQEFAEDLTKSFAYGGSTDLIPPDKTGKWGGDYTKSKNPKTGKVSNTWNAMTKFGSPEEYAQAVGYNGDPQNIKAMQRWIMKNYPDVVNEIHSSTEYGMPKKEYQMMDTLVLDGMLLHKKLNGLSLIQVFLK